MNAIQIKKMLNNILADYTGMGRQESSCDIPVINTIMMMYCRTTWLDWQECKWLFINYLEGHDLDFPAARRMALKRQYI